MLELQQLSPEQVVQSGGVNGWYHYVATHSILEQVSDFSKLADRLSTWLEENGLLNNKGPTRKPF